MSLFALVLFISASILFVAGDSQHGDPHVPQQVIQVKPHTTHQVNALVIINELLTSNEFDASFADILPNMVELPCCSAGCPIGACTTAASLISRPSQPINETQIAVPAFAEKVTFAPTEPVLIIEATQTWQCGFCPSTTNWCPCTDWSHGPTPTSTETVSATSSSTETRRTCTEGEFCPCTTGLTTTLPDSSQPTKAAEFPPEQVGCARCSKGSEWCACSNLEPLVVTSKTTTSEPEPSSPSIPAATGNPNLIPVIALTNSSTPTILWAHIDLFTATNIVSESVAQALQHVKIGTHEISLSLVAGSQLSKFSDVTFTVVEDSCGAQVVLGIDFVREAFALTLHEAYLGEAVEGVPVLFGRG